MGAISARRVTKPRRVSGARGKVSLKKPVTKRKFKVIAFSKTGLYFDGKVYRNRKTGKELFFEFDAKSGKLELKEREETVAECFPDVLEDGGIRPVDIDSYFGEGSGAGVLPVFLHYFKSNGVKWVSVMPSAKDKLIGYYRSLGFKASKESGSKMHLDLRKVGFA